ncbi:MAG: hypothetical protein JO131_08115 [Gammaproteobacteria bacterium]|nr:hypothetical protein [Gammaproteobacteria bacterium]
MYTQLILPKEEGLVILWLDRKIRSTEIDKNFTYQNIKEAIQDVAALEPRGQPHTERILRNLLHHYIERPPNSPARYKLTEYAIKFIKLIENKLSNPFQNFPLRESFKRYANFKAEDIKDIDQLEDWFDQGFNNTTRQTVVDHLEALKDEVNNSIHQLNNILRLEEDNTLEKLLKFTEVFKKFGEKSDEIRDTLKLGNELNQNIQKVVDLFYKSIEEYKHPESKDEYNEFNIIKNQHQRALLVQEQISSFFTLIDEKLDQLREKIIFASTKLTDLQQQFQYQSKFKVNLKRFLEFTLNEGIYSIDGPILPSIFPIKQICFESFNLTKIPYYQQFLSSKNTIIHSILDINYERKEKDKIKYELKKQESTAKWLQECIKILQTQKYLNFSEHFFKILQSEDDIDIALQVAYELLLVTSNSIVYTISIDRTPIEGYLEQRVAIWKMIIQKL